MRVWLGSSRTGDLGSKQELAKQGKEPALELREWSLSKLGNREDYAVLGSEQLDMAEEQVSMGRGQVGWDNFTPFLGNFGLRAFIRWRHHPL